MLDFDPPISLYILIQFVFSIVVVMVTMKDQTFPRDFKLKPISPIQSLIIAS